MACSHPSAFPAPVSSWPGCYIDPHLPPSPSPGNKQPKWEKKKKKKIKTKCSPDDDWSHWCRNEPDPSRFHQKRDVQQMASRWQHTWWDANAAACRTPLILTTFIVRIVGLWLCILFCFISLTMCDVPKGTKVRIYQVTSDVVVVLGSFCFLLLLYHVNWLSHLIEITGRHSAKAD